MNIYNNNTYITNYNTNNNNNNNTSSFTNNLTSSITNNTTDNSILFYKIYHNIYLKRLIFKYIRLYNIFSSVREFQSIEELEQFKFRNYLQHVKFTIQDSSSDQIKKLKDALPNNIQSLDLFYIVPHRSTKANYTTSDLLGHIEPIWITLDIPLWIKSIKLEDYYDVPNYYILNNLNLLNLTSINAKLAEILPNSLPNSLTKLTIPAYPWKIKANTLPTSLKSLHIIFSSNCIGIGGDEYYDLEYEEEEDDGILIEKGSLPNGLTDLKIGGFFNYLIKKGTFPNSLKYLTIESVCKAQLYDNFFPDSITNLNIEVKSLNIQLPNSLKELIIAVDKKLDKDYQLPPSLEHLEIETTKVLTHKNLSTSSNNLLDLVFGYGMDSSLIDCYGVSIIPKSIRSIDMGFFYNRPLDPVVFEGCRNLKSIKFGLNFNQRIAPNVLPESITYISFKNFDNGGFSLIEDGFRFPKDLEYIDFGIIFDQAIGVNTFSKSGNLKTIKFGPAFKQQIIDDSIPASVTMLEFSNSNYQYSFNLCDPVNTNLTLKIFKKVILQSPFKEMISSVEYSDNGYFENLNEAHYQSFPITLKHLKLPFDYNDPIKKLSLVNKSKLEYLEFGYQFNQPLLKQDLPVNNSIRVLVLGEGYNQTLNLEYFKSLEILKCFGNPKLITTKVNNQHNSIITPYNQGEQEEHSQDYDDYSMKDYTNNSSYLSEGESDSAEFSETENEIPLESESENEESQNEEDYIFYNLKAIETPVDNNKFLNSLNPVYFKFIHLTKSIN